MKRMILVLLASAAASPALAQHSGHNQAAPAPAPAASCTPEHAAMGHCTIPEPDWQSPASTSTCTAEHAATGHCQLPADAEPQLANEPNPQARQDIPDPPAQPSRVACSPEHAAMGHCAPSSEAEIPEGPPPPAAFVGPAHAQDLFFDQLAAARSRAELAKEHGGLKAYRFLVDQLEASPGRGSDGYAWDAQFWYGGDISKVWLKTEGEGEFEGGLEGVEVQALWSRAIDPWFDLQAGVRQDFRSGPNRTHLVLGVQGLAPYWFEIDGAVFLSNKAEITARVEVEYDLRITQYLIIQPRSEIDLSFQDVEELALGSGLSSAELGARLRYELYPRSGPAVLAPYIGVQYERAFGDTARFRRAAGEDVGGWHVLAGVRTWF
jgi:copper resistance protein B